MSHSDSEQTPSAGGYEKRDVNVRQLVLWTTVSVLFIILSIVFLRDYFIIYTEKIKYQVQLAPDSNILRDLRAREDQVLNSYKLIDSANGVYQIPITRAIELYADRAWQSAGGK